MKRETLVGLAIGVPAGLIIGYFVGAAHLFDSEAMTTAPVAAAPIPAAMGQLEAQQRIVAGEAAVAQNPKDAMAWVQLGNGYCDLHLAQKAVDAYAKALTLAPNLPQAADVLTDQGIMYRELKDFDKAIANFRQANKVNPAHVQSMFNLGVVYASDKHDTPEAIKAFKKVIEIAPNQPQAEQARRSIEELQATAKP